MSDKTERQRANINKLEQKGSLSKAEAQKAHERVDRAEFNERTSTTPTNLGGGDGTKK